MNLIAPQRRRRIPGFSAVAALALCLAAATAGSTGDGDFSRLDPRLRAALTSRFAAERLAAAGRQGPTIPCFIEGPAAPAALRAAGAVTGTRVGNITTARIPAARLSAVAAVPGVDRITAAGRLRPTLDLSVPDTRAGLVMPGPADTTGGLRGDSVLVGVVDTGVDWTHSDFKTAAGTTRIDRIWDQNDSLGPPPAPYTYGTRWLTGDIDLGLCRERDSTFFGHGTHVAGIAAGSGRGTGNGQPAFTYAGLARRARLAVVSTTFYETEIIDGVSWIFQQAAALGLPAVVNLSLGTAFGPHDGTTAFERALNGLCGPGRIVVASAGNSNGYGSHGHVAVPSTGDPLLAFRVFGYTPSPSIHRGVFLDGWYEGGNNFSVTVHTPSGILVGPVLKGTRLTVPTADGYVSIDQMGVEAQNSNGDVEVLLEVSDAAGTPVTSGDWQIQMGRVAAPSGGAVDFWIYDDSFPYPPAFLVGRLEGDIVLSPATADSVIGVAAHTTKTQWTSINGSTYSYGQTLGQIATFSCPGPRRDGVLKPDLSAPGTAIGSTHSSTSQPNPTANILPDGVHKVLEGTSMSGPHVTGAVALLLSQWPWLSSGQAAQALRQGARPDGFTGAVPNATWGWGKLDVERVLRDRLAFTVTADSARTAPPGAVITLIDLCAVPAPGSWSTRYSLRVTDTKGWLNYDNGGAPAPIPGYTATTGLVGSGRRGCAPTAGHLTIVVPPGATDGEMTTVSFEAAPEKVAFLKKVATTTVTVGTASAVGPGEPTGPTHLSLAAPGLVRGHESVAIHIAAPRAGHVTLALCDVTGRLRAHPFGGNLRLAGDVRLEWPATDDGGRRLPSGVYFLRAGDGVETAVARIVIAR